VRFMQNACVWAPYCKIVNMTTAPTPTTTPTYLEVPALWGAHCGRIVACRPYELYARPPYSVVQGCPRVKPHAAFVSGAKKQEDRDVTCGEECCGGGSSRRIT
jgi:hypothetical protein